MRGGEGEEGGGRGEERRGRVEWRGCESTRGEESRG